MRQLHVRNKGGEHPTGVRPPTIGYGACRNSAEVRPTAAALPCPSLEFLSQPPTVLRASSRFRTGQHSAAPAEFCFVRSRRRSELVSAHRRMVRLPMRRARKSLEPRKLQPFARLVDARCSRELLPCTLSLLWPPPSCATIG